MKSCNANGLSAVMFRFFSIFLIVIIPSCFAQSFPAFRWAQEVDGSGMDQFSGIGTDAIGNVYIAGSTTSPTFPVKSAAHNHLASPGLNDVFVTKLDSSGNVVYSTYFGGSGDDIATAMTVDPAGNVYVTGTTSSTDFPTTPGTYSPAIPPPGGPPSAPVTQESTSFLFKLNPDGTVAYATYFSTSMTTPNAIAVDSTGSVYLTGTTFGGLVSTPGAYRTSCSFCIPPPVNFFFGNPTDAFLSRFNASGSKLIYSTYLGVPFASGQVVAVAPDGSAYVGGPVGVYRIDATGSSLLASVTGLIATQAMTIAADGSVYLAGMPSGDSFQPTAGAFQTNSNPLPDLPSLPNRTTQLPITTPGAIAKMDPQLQHVLAATYFYGITGSWINSLALDAAGNIYAGGYTATGLPTRTPLVEGFGAGFLSELSGDLSTLLFSTYLGANTSFGVLGIALGPNGSVIIGGPEIVGNKIVCSAVCDNRISIPANIWVNSLAPAAPPALRIDSIVNAASLIDGPISAGETILVRGAGFGSDAHLIIGGTDVTGLSANATEITATVPPGIPNGPAQAVVQSGGAASNQVLLPIATTSPGVFAANGNGYGQGYILNNDGTLNTPQNPAAPGDRITIYATGVGPVSFTNGFAVTRFPSNLFIDGFYCDGVAAFQGSIAGFPGDVYQLTVYVPNPPNFTYPALSPVILQMDGVSSQYGIAISIRQ